MRTQMVWADKTTVGCAGVAGSDGYYRFVCRYSPPGNVMGTPGNRHSPSLFGLGLINT